VTRCGDSVERDTGVRCVLVCCLAGAVWFGSSERRARDEPWPDATATRDGPGGDAPRAARRQSPNFATCMTDSKWRPVKNSTDN